MLTMMCTKVLGTLSPTQQKRVVNIVIISPQGRTTNVYVNYCAALW